MWEPPPVTGSWVTPSFRAPVVASRMAKFDSACPFTVVNRPPT